MRRSDAQRGRCPASPTARPGTCGQRAAGTVPGLCVPSKKGPSPASPAAAVRPPPVVGGRRRRCGARRGLARRGERSERSGAAAMGAPGTVAERRRPRRRRGQLLRGQLCALAALALLLAGCVAGRGGECGAAAGGGGGARGARLRRAAPRGPARPGFPRGVRAGALLSRAGCCAPGAAPAAARNLAELDVRLSGAGPPRPGGPAGTGWRGPDSSCGAGPRDGARRPGVPCPPRSGCAGGGRKRFALLLLRSRECKQNSGKAYLPLRREERTPP